MILSPGRAMTSPSQNFNPELPAERISPEDKNHGGTQAYQASVNVYKNDISPAEVADFYTSWAADYEKGLYLGPDFVADTLASLLTTNKDSVRVLDVAAGTGILGEKLYEAGFRNIDGLDPSPGMLEICRSKNIYSDLIRGFMTEKPSHISADTYDCLSICGGMGPGHIPRGALREMIRIVKPGGYICNAMRQEFIDMSEEYNDNKLEDAMLQLEQSGLWKKIEQRILPTFFYDKPGVLFVHRVI